MIGDHVIDVREVLDHHGDTIVRGAYDGMFDKTNRPEALVLSSYFSVRDNKIVSLVVIFNRDRPFRTAVSWVIVGCCAEGPFHEVWSCCHDCSTVRCRRRLCRPE